MSVIILEEMIRIYTDVRGIYGYRRMTMNINRVLNTQYNYKRIYRLMKSVNMKSVIRQRKNNYKASTPQITAENVLNRKFQADKPNQKWLTDVTEFKLTNGQKGYLSAILDLGDKSIVSYILGHANNNQLVFARVRGRFFDSKNKNSIMFLKLKRERFKCHGRVGD